MRCAKYSYYSLFSEKLFGQEEERIYTHKKRLLSPMKNRQP